MIVCQCIDRTLGCGNKFEFPCCHMYISDKYCDCLHSERGAQILKKRHFWEIDIYQEKNDYPIFSILKIIPF